MQSKNKNKSILFVEKRTGTPETNTIEHRAKRAVLMAAIVPCFSPEFH